MKALLRDVPEEIETRRLLLRCPRPGDGLSVYKGVVDTLQELRAWPASLPWAMFDPSVGSSEEFCRNGYSDYVLRKNLPMLLFLKEGNIYVGASGLHAIDWGVPKFEIGYWCRKQFQGRGLITEAVTAITAFAMQSLGAKRIVSLADARNKASRVVAERAGYRLEGIMTNERIGPDGTLCNTCIYAITP